MGTNAFNLMRLYKVKSPSGRIIEVYALTTFHAIQKAVEKEGYKYSNPKYKIVKK